MIILFQASQASPSVVGGLFGYQQHPGFGGINRPGGLHVQGKTTKTVCFDFVLGLVYTCACGFMLPILIRNLGTSKQVCKH